MLKVRQNSPTLSIKDWNQYTKSLQLFRNLERLGKNNVCLPGVTLVINSSLNRFKENIRSYRHINKSRGNKVYTLDFNRNGAYFRVESTNLKDLVEKKKKLIRDHRREQSRVASTGRRYFVRGSNTYITHELVGKVHMTPGVYLRHAEALKAKNIFKAKSPKTTEKHVGIELEFIANASRDVLAIALSKNNLSNFVELKSDGSIQVDVQGYSPHELAICVPESLMEEVVNKVVSVLKLFDARVNKSTGMHVHLDARASTGRNHRYMFARLVMAQSILFAMQPNSRKDNRFCKRTKSQDYTTALSTGRYQGVNPQSVSRHNTIEIRIHSGTVGASKIINWIKILIGIVDCDIVEAKRAPRTVESFCKAFKIGADLRAYIEERIQKFSTNGEVEVS